MSWMIGNYRWNIWTLISRGSCDFERECGRSCDKSESELLPARSRKVMEKFATWAVAIGPKSCDMSYRTPGVIGKDGGCSRR